MRIVFTTGLKNCLSGSFKAQWAYDISATVLDFLSLSDAGLRIA